MDKTCKTCGQPLPKNKIDPVKADADDKREDKKNYPPSWPLSKSRSEALARHGIISSYPKIKR